MRLLPVFFLFCAMASGQNVPDNQLNSVPGGLLKKRLESMKLLNAPQAIRAQPFLTFRKPAACAIPLLNALPAQSNVDYKLRISKPPATARAIAISPQVGIPACQ